MVKEKLINHSFFRLENPQFSYLLIGLLVALRFVWIGDASFISDEPLFVDLGYQFMQTGNFMTLGLKGKMGVHYGPYTAWFFRVLLEISKNLIVVTYLKTFIVTIMTLVSALWLVKSVDWIKLHFIIPIFASLFIFIYSRMLWDLNISMTFLAFAAYISFVKSNRFWKILWLNRNWC